MVGYDCRSFSAAVGGLPHSNALPALQHQFDDVPGKNMHHRSMRRSTMKSLQQCQHSEFRLLLLVLHGWASLENMVPTVDPNLGARTSQTLKGKDISRPPRERTHNCEPVCILVLRPDRGNSCQKRSAILEICFNSSKLTGPPRQQIYRFARH